MRRFYRSYQHRPHRSLPDQMPLKAKRVRYAVSLWMLETEGITGQLALLQLSGLREDILALLYEEINAADLASRYMTAIDTYPRKQLEPAFIDLIECLMMLDTPSIRTFLNDPELAIIVRSYKLALGPLAAILDLESVDLRQFSTSFRATLKKLFDRPPDHFCQITHQSSSQINLFNQLSSSYLPQKILAEQYIYITEKRLRTKLLRRQRQNKFRARHGARIREKNRNRRRQTREFIQHIQVPEQSQEWPVGIDEMFKRLKRERVMNRERQKRYRERNGLSVVMKRQERRRLEQQQSLMHRNTTTEQRPDRIKEASAQSPSVLRPIESSMLDRHVEHESKVSDWPKRSNVPTDQLERLERERRLNRERQRRYRERHLLRFQTLEHEPAPQPNVLPTQDGLGAVPGASRSEQGNPQQSDNNN